MGGSLTASAHRTYLPGRSTTVNALKIHLDDNVVTAVSELAPGTAIALDDGGSTLDVTVAEDVPFGHKVAIVPIAEGEAVVKYGASIGLATTDIAPGQHVHVHNLRSVRGAASS